MFKKVLCIAAALCGFIGLAHGELTYTQTPALFLSIGNNSPLNNPQRIASNGAGLTVAVWSAPAKEYSYGLDGIFIQRYDANGTPLGSLVRIDPTKSCDSCIYEQLTQPLVAINPQGLYVVLWKKGSVVWAHLYDEQGKLTKEEELLTTSDIGWSWSSSSADLQMDANGNFVVVYNRNGDIFARRFDAQGARVGAEITVSNNTSFDKSPSLAMNGNGAFAVVWQRARTTGCSDSQYSKPDQCDDILLRRFDNQDTPLGAESKVADGNNNFDQTPSIDIDNEGNLVVAWDRYRDLCQNMLRCDDILAQRYNAGGVKQGKTLAVISNTNQNDTFPRVARDGNGKFVIMWSRDGTVVSPADALFRSYDANGLSLGGTVSYRIASGLSSSQFNNWYPVVGISDMGKLNVLWWTTNNPVLVYRQMIPSDW